MPEYTQKPETTSRKLRVLVVDDNEVLTQTLIYMIELLGHETRLAHNGADALTAALSFLPEVILLDIGLPDMSGYDVCRKLRAEPALKRSSIIAQSGWNQPQYHERSKEAGFDHYFVKPLKFNCLEEIFLWLS
jgi:CheY-like chemotaxis protein